MGEHHRNLIRTWWWNKAQLLGLITAVAVTIALILTEVAILFLLVWALYLPSGILLPKLSDYFMWDFAPMAYLIVTTVMLLLLAPTWGSRLLLLSAVVIHFFCVVLPGYGKVSLEAYERVKNHLAGSTEFDDGYVRYLIDNSYCYRSGATMHLRERLGRFEVGQLVRRLR